MFETGVRARKCYRPRFRTIFRPDRNAPPPSPPPCSPSFVHSKVSGPPVSRSSFGSPAVDPPPWARISVPEIRKKNTNWFRESVAVRTAMFTKWVVVVPFVCLCVSHHYSLLTRLLFPLLQAKRISTSALAAVKVIKLEAGEC